MNKLDTKKWLTEIHRGSALSFEYSRVLFDKKSPYQHIQIVETKSHGRMLVNDGFVMTCERDEFIYHEMISHVPLFTHPCPKDVLVIGGGDGGTVREVLKHPQVETCTMVEIDSLVVEACKQHLPSIGTDFDNPRLQLVFDDGAKFVKDKQEEFDLVIVDSSDPIGPGKILFEEEFYKDLHACLRPEGLIVAQAESPMYDMEFQRNLAKQARKMFKLVGLYNYYNLTYPGGFWSFLICSKKYHPLKDFNLESFKARNLSLKYYNSDIHKSCFTLAEFMKINLDEIQNLL